MKLLIIEDEEDILSALLRGFKKRGYIAEGAQDGLSGLEMAQAGGYDLVVLDLNLPEMDGMEVLRRLRAEDKSIKILILSARVDFPDRISGLDGGANDYLVKPFDFGELEARVRNLLRRDFVQQDVMIRCCGVDIDTASRRVFAPDGKQIELSPKEYTILEYLAMKRGVAVSAEELIEHAWEGEDVFFSNAVKVHISQLRKKLSPYCADAISHIRGAGYIIER